MVLLPQQTGVSSVLTAHVCESPALICFTAPMPAGIVVCPLALLPQQTGVPSVLIAHVCDPPALIRLTVPMPAGIVV